MDKILAQSFSIYRRVTNYKNGPMKIIGFTIMTDPEYRQDPWRESIRQALEVFDFVVVCYGAVGDGLLLDEMRTEYPGRILSSYMEWPQPEWHYDELPRHLNRALELCKSADADWAVKFDIDYFFHEKEKNTIRNALTDMKYRHVQAGTFEKYQFFMADRAHEKGKMPLALNMDFDICYGKDSTRYTDLCQPIVPNGGATPGYHMEGYHVPTGTPLTKTQFTGAHMWNYDYTFKTLERSKELLYHFDLSHASWWKQGYTGRPRDQITPESALEDYLNLVRGRIQKCVHKFKPADHPKMVQSLVVRALNDSRLFGHSLWGMVEIPKL